MMYSVFFTVEFDDVTAICLYIDFVHSFYPYSPSSIPRAAIKIAIRYGDHRGRQRSGHGYYYQGKYIDTWGNEKETLGNVLGGGK